MGKFYLASWENVMHPIALYLELTDIDFIWPFYEYSFSGEGNGNPLQYFCLENPMDGGAW